MRRTFRHQSVMRNLRTFCPSPANPLQPIYALKLICIFVVRDHHDANISSGIWSSPEMRRGSKLSLISAKIRFYLLSDSICESNGSNICEEDSCKVSGGTTDFIRPKSPLFRLAKIVPTPLCRSTEEVNERMCQ